MDAADSGWTGGSMNERGVALVMVLGVVAIVSAWAATAAYEDMISLRRAENLQESTRAWMANESAMELVRYYLREDMKNNKSDHLDEDWAQSIPPLPIDDGVVTGKIIDANRYFNINDLVNQHGDLKGDAYQIARRLFARLELPVTLVDRLVDWLDADDRTISASGAEDDHYYDQPYHAKNARLDRWQELSLIDGFDKEALEKLRSAVIVTDVPQTEKTLVNINTAEKVVLMALFPKMTEGDAEEVMASRPYETLPAGAAWMVGGDVTRLSVASDAFIVRTEARFGRARWREEYLLKRSMDGKIAIAYREHRGWMQ